MSIGLLLALVAVAGVALMRAEDAARRADRLADQLAELQHEHAADRERLGDLERFDEELLVGAAGVACVAIDEDEPTTPGQAPSDGTTRDACDWES